MCTRPPPSLARLDTGLARSRDRYGRSSHLCLLTTPVRLESNLQGWGTRQAGWYEVGQETVGCRGVCWARFQNTHNIGLVSWDTKAFWMSWWLNLFGSVWHTPAAECRSSYQTADVENDTVFSVSNDSQKATFFVKVPVAVKREDVACALWFMSKALTLEDGAVRWVKL